MQDYCKAGLNTSNERFILHFLESVDEKEELEFNMVCQKLMTSMLLCLDKAIKHKESNIHSSFWFNMFSFMNSETFTDILASMPAGMSHRTFLATLLFSLVTHFEIIM